MGVMVSSCILASVTSLVVSESGVGGWLCWGGMMGLTTFTHELTVEGEERGRGELEIN